ncbi:MAG: T9SS type A sorting domain-containing protein [Bacteroidetes bacterium]|nr:MAG: T9SS type A sorting domain-containing protein [Bacteroidota bacterium]
MFSILHKNHTVPVSSRMNCVQQSQRVQPVLAISNMGCSKNPIARFCVLAETARPNCILHSVRMQSGALVVFGVTLIISMMQCATKATIQFCVVAFFIIPVFVSAQTDAFPGAEGFGRYATGGRGGRVIEVTNLNDNGAGSLRAAIDATGPRTVVFRVSGTIKLLSSLRIKKGDVTIAGQTAPGDGICLRDRACRVEANNVIIRFMRFRLGDSTRVEDDSFSGNGDAGNMKRNIIIDHCSISWAIDENSSFYDNGMFTLQYCYITESLYHSYHSKGNHGYGGMWGGWKTSFHHNLFAHNSSRNPRFNGSRYTQLPDSEMVDFRNNVLYNWGFNNIYGGEGGSYNLVGNYYKYGPGTNTSSIRYRIVQPSDTTGNWYISDNYVYGNDSVTADNWNGGVQGGNASYLKNKKALLPFPYGTIATETAEVAYEKVLAHGGASFPKRDTIDARIANEVRTQTATYGGVWGANKGIIDSPDDVGGYPLLQSTAAPADTDHDGMPDDWETFHGLNPADSTDGMTITGDGYSNLEHYINGLVDSVMTGIDEGTSAIPSEFTIKQNYPNPFNPTTVIEFSLPKRSHVLLEVFDMRGLLVKTLVDDTIDYGIHRVVFDASRMSTGIYFSRLSSGTTTITRKMLLLK